MHIKSSMTGHGANTHKFRHPDVRRELPLIIQRLIKSRGSSLVPRDGFMEESWRQKEKQLPHRKPVAKNNKSKCSPEQSFRRRRKLPRKYKECPPFRKFPRTSG